MTESSRSELSLLDHLEELRWRLFKSAAAILICAIPCGIYWRKIFDILAIHPLRFTVPRPHLIFTKPGEAVIISIKIAFAGGAILAIPFVLYQIWKFISPGLYKKEKDIVLPAVISSTICFLMGISFCYLMLPYMVKFLASYGGTAIEPFFRADDYMSFILQMVLAFGLVFELPVISFILSRMGIVSPKLLIDKGRYAIIVIFIIAAILTPPDILSQTVLAVPLLLLYGISIFVSHLAYKKKEVA